MISTRLHGLIDYTVTSLLGVLAVAGPLSPPMRRVLGTAAACHGSYAALTDYEGGLQPRISMRAHLALDVLGAVGLCGAALLLRRQPTRQRALLLAAGVAELAVVAASSARPVRGPGQGAGPVDRLLGARPHPNHASYPPLDTPKPFADDVFVVDSVLPGVLERVLPVRMTVIRLPNGDLLLHSPTRYSIALKLELEKLGRIRHLVAPSFGHWIHMLEWQQAYPDAVTWAAPGLRKRSQVRRSGLRLDHDLSEMASPAFEDAIGVVVVPGGLGFNEAALFHQPSRTLVLTDLVLNLEQQKLPALARPLLQLFGVTAPDGMPPPYLRAIVKMQGVVAADTAKRLLALHPERVIFAHGRCFDRDGEAALRRSLRWLLG